METRPITRRDERVQEALGSVEGLDDLSVAKEVDDLSVAKEVDDLSVAKEVDDLDSRIREVVREEIEDATPE